METPYTRDGLPLHLRQWRLRGAARGTVLVVHGLGEHIGRYAAVAEALNAAGWHVAGHDQRGHGASGGGRGALASRDALLDDLSRVIDVVRPQAGDRLVLLGHSMGGLVAARFVAEALSGTPAGWARPVDALALSSPALAVAMTAPQRWLLGATRRWLPQLAVGNGLPVDALSRDPAVVRDYLADPLVHDRITPRLASFIIEAGDEVRRLAPRWRLPTWLAWAGDDRCVDPIGSARFAESAPPSLLRAMPWPALRHELFNEPERQAVLAALVDWLQRQSLPAAAPVTRAA